MRSDAFADARAVIEHGLADRVFPAAVVNVGSRAGVRWQQAFGRLTYADDAPACTAETLFDLASLTKVIATTPIAMAHVRAGRLNLDAPVATSPSLAAWRDDERRGITVRQLLDHSSGLPAHLRAWETASGRDAYLRLIRDTPLDRPPASSAVYSDVGFMLLGFLLEDIGGAPLDRQISTLLRRRIDPIQYRPQPPVYERTAPTEFDPWRGRVLCGEVHDENAAALGGVAAHAGLFGTADAVGRYAQLVLETFDRDTVLGTPELMRMFAQRSTVPGSSRALGWDTALPTSSCGTRMSATAIGHTGFTGTSLWIDWERDVYAVLLTNRVHPSRTNQKLIPLRPAFHDALPRP
jgi:CubicO group peptidase (beta-lactamase class C family)